jgi:CheY-like chemotaxis protein
MNNMSGSRRILIVDDDRFVRDGLKELLSEMGYDSQTAEDGYEAIQKVQEGSYDLILMDLILPGLSGVSTMASIFEMKPFSNVIAMTAYSDNSIIASAMSMGARKCLIKPVDLSLLEDTLKEAVLM